AQAGRGVEARRAVLAWPIGLSLLGTPASQPDARLSGPHGDTPPRAPRSNGVVSSFRVRRVNGAVSADLSPREAALGDRNFHYHGRAYHPEDSWATRFLPRRTPCRDRHGVRCPAPGPARS